MVELLDWGLELRVVVSEVRKSEKFIFMDWLKHSFLPRATIPSSSYLWSLDLWIASRMIVSPET